MPDVNDPKFQEYLAAAKGMARDKEEEVSSLRAKLGACRARCAELGPKIVEAEGNSEESRVKALVGELFENFQVQQRVTARLAKLGERV